MKFLIQKIDKEVRHDFGFHLVQAIHYQKWLDPKSKFIIKYLNFPSNTSDDAYPVLFEDKHKEFIPIGSVEFVLTFLNYFYGIMPQPRNVPVCLFDFAERDIFNGTDTSLEHRNGIFFAKSNDKIKGYSSVINTRIDNPVNLPLGNYQFSEYISIESEWRAFVFEGKLVGLQNYSGDFTKFPDVERITEMIKKFSDHAPVAYTLDVGVNDTHTYSNDIGTFIIEVHDFFSCGLYGFSDYRILPYMFHRWIQEYTKHYQVK